MATSQQLEARDLMKQLRREHVLSAIQRIDAGEDGGFADSVRYDLVLDGRTYAPKRAVGLALHEFSGKVFDPYAFKGGEESAAFRTLRRLKFDLSPKLPEPQLQNRAYVLGAVEALGSPTRAEIKSYILEREPGFVTSNITPDLQLLTVNSDSRGHHYHNRKPRRCDTGDLFDVLFQVGTGRGARFVLYDPSVHGIWELTALPGDPVLRPRLSQPAAVNLALQKAIADAQAHRDFDPTSTRDARERTMRAIAVRQGQPKFRQDLIAAYEGKCAISGFDAAEALEAAHIVPFRGEHTNVARNGLLLRADLHSLFDQGLFRVDPQTFQIILSPQLKASAYQQFAGTKLRLPASQALWPDPEALEIHGKQSSAP